MVRINDHRNNGSKCSAMTGFDCRIPTRALSIDEVRTAFSATYPEIATASVTGPEAVGNKLVYYFTKAIGTKG